MARVGVMVAARRALYSILLINQITFSEDETNIALHIEVMYKYSKLIAKHLTSPH